ncbi:hypothetical protein Tco_0949554, partial [Tanacetum coccineum]
DGTDFQPGVPDEQQRKIFDTDEGTGAKPGVPDVPKYDYESDKESWADSGEEDDDDEDNTKDDEGNDDSDGNDDDDDDGDSDNERTESDRDENPNLNQSNKEHEEEEEYIDEFTNKEDDADNANEENEEDDDAERSKSIKCLSRKTEGPMQSSSISSDFTEKLLNFENVSPSNNEIASLMDTTICHEEPIATPTPTPTTSEATTSFPTIPNFSSVFKFNDRVTKLESDLSEMKQVEQYAQAISSIPAIIDHYINNKLGEAIHKAIQSHNAECREEAQVEKHEYIDLVDTSVRTIIREELKTQPPQILPKAVSDFATSVIEQNVTESLEAVVLAKSSSQPKSTYEAAASLSEYELTKILLDKIEESKSHLRADYKRKLYDALVESYNTDKDLFNTYSEVFTLKRSRYNKDKDQDPSAGSDRGTKIRKSSKDVKPSRDTTFKDSKSTSSSKGTSRSQHKSSGKSAHAEEPSNTVDDSRVQQNQEFDTINNDEQPDDETISKDDWYNDPDWNKRQQVDFRPSQTWISNMSRTEKPHMSFDELMDTPIDFSAGMTNGHLVEIEVRREDQQLYTFKEGDFPRLRLQDIKDMLLLLVQQRLTNLTIYECFDLNVALHPQEVIYEDQNNRNRLIRTDELHKFSDRTLNYVLTALHDISLGLRMDYLPKRIWSNLDERRARVMIQDIDKQLFQRRIILAEVVKKVNGRNWKKVGNKMVRDGQLESADFVVVDKRQSRLSSVEESFCLIRSPLIVDDQ